MTTDESSSLENIWQEIEALVLGLAQLSRTEISSQKFYSELLDRAVRGISALGGALWIPDSDGILELYHSLGSNPETNPRALSQQEIELHRLLLRETLQENQPTTVAALAGISEQHQGKNPTSENLILCPIAVENHSEARQGILEIFHRPPQSFAAQDGYLRFIVALCEISDDYFQHRQFQKLREQELLWDQFEKFTEHVHLHLNSQQTAYIIANEGRLLIDCDRVSVLQRTGNTYRLIAASGIDVIESRSESVQRLESFVDCIQSLNRPYWVMEADQKYPPQISEAMHHYLDLASSRSLMILPLRHITVEPVSDVTELKTPNLSDSRQLMIGAIVVEQFRDIDTSGTLLDRSMAVSRHGGTALYNALQFESFPFFPLLKHWSHSPVRNKRMTWRNGIAGIGILGLVCLILFLTPADFKIEGSGALQPVEEKNIFASANGIVDQIFVRQGEQIQAGDTLVVLRDSDLELEFSRVQGEIQTVQKRLTVIQAARLELNPQDANALQRANRLTGEREELNERLKSLKEQLALLKNKQDSLTLKSPIPGEVLTWDLQEKLLARPVQRGQKLLTVADLNGPWILKMEVPDSEIGHVLEAQQQSNQPLNVTFLLLTDPDQTYQGTIKNIAATAEPDADGIPTVQITVSLDHESIEGLRPGATVLPQIDCGRRSLGYVWLRRLIETVQREVLFF